MRIKLLFFFLLFSINIYAQNLTLTGKPDDFRKEPQLKWKFKTNGAFISGPVIDSNTVFCGSLDSTLYALDKNTSALKWKFRTFGPVRSSVCIWHDKLFLFSGDGNVYCLNKKNGKVIWRFKSYSGYLGERRNDFADYFHSSPVCENKILYVGASDYMFALDPDTGELIWSFRTGDVVHTTPAFHNGKLFFGSFDGHLYAVDAKTGLLLWKFKTTGHRFFPKGEVMGNPVVAGGLVIAGSRDYNLYAIDINGGFCHWMKQFPKGWALPVTVNDTAIYLGTSDDRQLFAIEPVSGRIYWKAEAKFNVFGNCAISRSMGYFGNLAGKLFGFDLKTGTIIWTYITETYKQNHLKYLKADDNYRDDISELIQSNDDILLMYRNLGAFFSTPAISDNMIFIASFDGIIYCLKNQD